jgi:UDP-glucose 4-epimerase
MERYTTPGNRQVGDMKNTVLVIGAGGFLGRALCAALERHGFTVCAIVHQRKNIPATVQVVSRDWVKAHGASIRYVFYATGNYRQQFDELYQSQIFYLKETLTLLPRAVCIYVSSTAVYGMSDEIITERSCFHNPEHYGLAKIAGEFIASHHPSYRIIRLTALYGQGMHQDLFLPSIIRQAQDARKITLLGDGSRKQNYLHVRDAADLLIAASQYRQSGIFLGCSIEYANKEIAKIVAVGFPETRIEFHGHDTAFSFRMNNAATMRMLGWKPKVAIQEGMAEMIRSTQ